MTNVRWPEVTLGDYCARITVGHVGPMADRYVSIGIPFLRSQDIAPFAIQTNAVKFIDADFDAQLRKSRLQAGDVAIVRTGYPGTAAVVPSDLGSANCADLVILTPGPKLDPWYVAALFNSSWGRGQVGGVLVGVAQQHFNVGAAKGLKVRLPPFPVQERIGGTIRAYSDLIAVNQRRIAVLEEMARRLFEEWFVRFRFAGWEDAEFVETDRGPVPLGWIPGCVADLACYINRGVTPKYSEAAETIAINQRCIRDHTLDFGAARRQSREVPEAKLVRHGDVLVNSTGVGTLGRVAQAFDVPPGTTVDTHVTIVRPAEGISATFFGLLMLSLEEHFERQGVGSTGQTELSRQSIADTPVLLPPSPLTEAWGRLAAPLRSQAVTLRKANSRLRAARDLLLPKLISGEIELDAAERELEDAA